MSGQDATPIVAVYNFKGGVSKTTLTLNLGYELATYHGKKVLLVDADPQMNLTQLAMRETVTKKVGGKGDVVEWNFEEYFDKDKQKGPDRKRNTIKEGLRPVTCDLSEDVKAAACFPLKYGNSPVVSKRREAGGNLWLLAGHQDLIDFEMMLTTAYRTNGNTDTRMLGALDLLVKRTAAAYNSDIVLIDTSPSKGTLNKHIFCMSDYLIIPGLPDYFTFEACRSLGDLLPRWLQEWRTLRRWAQEPGASEKLRANVMKMRVPVHGVPKLLGVVMSRFATNSFQEPVTNVKYWFNEIDSYLGREFKNKLKAITLPKVSEDLGQAWEKETVSLFLPEGVCRKASNTSTLLGRDTMLLGNLPDPGQTIALAQRHCVPIEALSDSQLTRFDRASFSEIIMNLSEKESCINQIQLLGDGLFAIAEKILTMTQMGRRRKREPEAKATATGKAKGESKKKKTAAKSHLKKKAKARRQK